jgi:deoxycytidylate deaminase
MNFDWKELAFGSKKPINELNAIFILAPRELSAARFKQILKIYLPQANIVLGLAKEPYINGFENQPQFKTLQLDTVQSIISKVNAGSSNRHVATLSYFQRDAKYILDKLDFQKIVLINGSWKYSFHTRHEYYTLINRNLPYEMITPFTDEAEAKSYAEHILPPEPPLTGAFTSAQMMQRAAAIATHSFDYSFQTGVALGRRIGAGDSYHLLAQTFNRVVPHQGYALHYGATREKHFSPPHDLNHYDANHAEVELIIRAQKEGIDLTGTTLFINLLPCPACARMFTSTDIAEFVYAEDHSNGYAVRMLEAAGKTVRRLIS